MHKNTTNRSQKATPYSRNDFHSHCLLLESNCFPCFKCSLSDTEEQEFQQEEPEIGDEADIATRSVEKELLFDITDSEKQNLDGIEAALRKIEKGVFGRCESCQKTIPRLRLEVMPWARYCIQCQVRNEIPSATPE